MQATYNHCWILSDEDVAEPEKVAEPSLDSVLKRHSVDRIDCVLLGKQSLVDDFWTEFIQSLLCDCDLESSLSI